MALFVVIAASEAQALGYTDIAGRWCNSSYIFTVTRTRFTMLPRDGRPQVSLTVKGFDYGADSIGINIQGRGTTAPMTFAILGPGQMRLGNDSISKRC